MNNLISISNQSANNFAIVNYIPTFVADTTIITRNNSNMKTTIIHSTQTKRSYKKPVLNKLGKVSKLTKGIKGSDVDDQGDFQQA